VRDEPAPVIQNVLGEQREPSLVGGPERSPAGRDREDGDRERQETQESERLPPGSGRGRRRDQRCLEKPGARGATLGMTTTSMAAMLLHGAEGRQADPDSVSSAAHIG
jgi:hypothetical protein